LNQDIPRWCAPGRVLNRVFLCQWMIRTGMALAPDIGLLLTSKVNEYIHLMASERVHELDGVSVIYAIPAGSLLHAELARASSAASWSQPTWRAFQTLTIFCASNDCLALGFRAFSSIHRTGLFGSQPSSMRVLTLEQGCPRTGPFAKGPCDPRRPWCSQRAVCTLRRYDDKHTLFAFLMTLVVA
jgi:hypothetical protein